MVRVIQKYRWVRHCLCFGGRQKREQMTTIVRIRVIAPAWNACLLPRLISAGFLEEVT